MCCTPARPAAIPADAHTRHPARRRTGHSGSWRRGRHGWPPAPSAPRSTPAPRRSRRARSACPPASPPPEPWRHGRARNWDRRQWPGRRHPMRRDTSSAAVRSPRDRHPTQPRTRWTPPSHNDRSSSSSLPRSTFRSCMPRLREVNTSGRAAGSLPHAANSRLCHLNLARQRHDCCDGWLAIFDGSRCPGRYGATGARIDETAPPAAKAGSLGYPGSQSSAFTHRGRIENSPYPLAGGG